MNNLKTELCLCDQIGNEHGVFCSIFVQIFIRISGILIVLRIDTFTSHTLYTPCTKTRAHTHNTHVHTPSYTYLEYDDVKLRILHAIQEDWYQPGPTIAQLYQMYDDRV